MQTTTYTKTSASIRNNNWQRLKDRENKSLVINKALEFYFDYEDLINENEKVYWNNVKKSLLNNNGEYISLNPNGEEVTSKVLDDILWK